MESQAWVIAEKISIIAGIIGIPLSIVLFVLSAKFDHLGPKLKLGVGIGARLVLSIAIIGLILWGIISYGPTLNDKIDSWSLGGPYYLKSVPITAEAQAIRLKQIKALRDTVAGCNSKATRDIVVIRVPSIEGGITGTELGELLKGVSDLDTACTIIECAPYLRYPLDEDQPLLLVGLSNEATTVCIKALAEMEQKAIKWQQLKAKPAK